MCKQEDTEGRPPKGGRGLRDEVQTGKLGGEGSRKKQWRPPPEVLMSKCHATTSPHPHPQTEESWGKSFSPASATPKP